MVLQSIERNKIIEKLSILAIASMFAAFFFSRFLLSVSQIIFIIIGILSLVLGRKILINKKNLIILGFSLLFIVPLITGLYSEDMSYYLERLRIKLPFLILPVPFILLPTLSKKAMNRLLDWFLLCAFAAIILVLSWYFMDMAAINEEVRLGGHFPTPSNHIRFALVMSIALIVSLSKFWQGTSRYSWAYLVLSVLIFVFLHILSVRSGLVSAYLGLMILAVYYVVQHKSWKIVLLLPVAMVAFLFLAWNIPSFKTKMGYTYWEIRELLSNAENNTTLTNRSKSYQCGWELFSNNLILGVGAGDTKTGMEQCWKEKFSEDDQFLLPHNQYLSFLAGHGIILGLLMIIVCLSPLYWHQFFISPGSVAILSILLLSFLFENTIENSLGVAIFSFFVFFLMRFDQSLTGDLRLEQ